MKDARTRETGADVPRAQASPDVLAAIVAATGKAVGDRRRSVPDDVLERRVASARAPRGQFFKEQLARPAAINVIAECKRRSPLKGVLREHYDPVALARGYAEAGAAALSILTEPAFFDGALEHLSAVRDVVDVPLLRKDFIVDRYQLLEACCAGADAALLIVSVLSRGQLRRLYDDARALGLATLVEVHTAAELDTALELGAEVIGVNNRDLKSQTVDTDASARLLERMPETCIAVAESGLRSGADVARLRRSGFDGFLIGEALVTTPDPGASLGALIADASALLAATPSDAGGLS
jgi:indole-3-glycerol phosphate synthase